MKTSELLSIVLLYVNLFILLFAYMFYVDYFLRSTEITTIYFVFLAAFTTGGLFIMSFTCDGWYKPIHFKADSHYHYMLAIVAVALILFTMFTLLVASIVFIYYMTTTIYPMILALDPSLVLIGAIVQTAVQVPLIYFQVSKADL